MSDPARILPLVGELCSHRVGVATPGNADLFVDVARELDLRLYSYPSGERFNGWEVPAEWWVQEATLWQGDRLIDDAGAHALGVAYYSDSFEGELSLDELRPHLVSAPSQPDARVFHCRWQYRPWEADWALSLPHRTVAALTPGRYRVRLRTVKRPGAMLVAEHEHVGASPDTIVFNAHTCHPNQANDGMVGVATLIRLFQWLRERETRLSYRLVLGPEHLGTVFYLRGRPRAELERLIGGMFVEMTGVPAPLVATSTFVGGLPLDDAVAHVLRHGAAEHRLVGWREGAGNDETVWEAPGYEVPFVELTRRIATFDPYPEYHTSLDTPESLDAGMATEALRVLKALVDVLERDCVAHRRFEGLVCLSSPEHGLYVERPDPSIDAELPDDADAWGVLTDRILRRFDGRTSVRRMADEAGLPFAPVRDYVQRFAEAGLVALSPADLARPPISAGLAPALATTDGER